MSVDLPPLNVVLCWHMHQPDYRGPEQSDFQLPWVYLHAIKDYSDMAAYLENEPQARAVVNFAPILLEQIDDYSAQIKAFFRRGKALRDPLLAALAAVELTTEPSERIRLIRACTRANEKRVINRFPMLRKLVDITRWIEKEPHLVGYFSDQFLFDLIVWYHLAWMGECLRRNDPRIAALERKGQGYSHEDRGQLLLIINEVLGGLVGRYRKLAEANRVELSVTPFAHPILPLLIDLKSAREALPAISLPALTSYPGGEERARWHIRQAQAAFERYFGFRPGGCWPAEGGICEATLRILEEEGFLWAASGQQVLYNSLSASSAGEPLPGQWLHQPYRLPEGQLGCFFHDDGLSDLIGFTYSDWHADDAVGNLIQHLVNIAEANRGNPDAIVSIIMDGENAWEYYPNNGNYFLPALYRQLAQHPRLRLTTFSDYLQRRQTQAPELRHLVAGSWVYGTFSTWIGDHDKNRAWEMLSEAKMKYDQVLAGRHLKKSQQAAVDRQLSTCEGSDWFWWFGDYNPADTVSDFERLFRRQLTHLYELLDEEPPKYLAHVFAHGTGNPELGGVMKRN